MKRSLLLMLIVAVTLGGTQLLWAQAGGGTPSPGGVMPCVAGAFPCVGATVSAPEVPIGADGTAYLIRPEVTISFGLVREVQYKTEIAAIGLDKNVPTKWKVSKPGLAQHAAVGETRLYLTAVSSAPIPIFGRGGSNGQTGVGNVAGVMAGLIKETQVLFVDTADGSTAKTVTVQGQVLGLQVRKVGSTEYVYLTVARPPGTSAGSSLGLVILDSTGAQVKALDAGSDAVEAL